MIQYIAFAVIILMMVGPVFFLIVAGIRRAIMERQPKRPKNIEAFAGNYMRGNCPKCGALVSNCDGNEMNGVSYCPCCGTKIQFPYHTPKIEGVKSVSIEQYTKEGKK